MTLPLRSEVALAVVLAGLSDHDVLLAYQAAAKTQDPRTREIGRELLVRLHRADPTSFPRELIDKYDEREG